jgi:hypothetical protein
MKQWETYHLHVGEIPNQLIVGCLNDFVTRREASLDLGAGNLRDSRFLQSQGFTKLVAVDGSEESRTFLTEGIELHISPIETFVPEKNAFDFAFSCNTLFFLTPSQVADVFKNVFKGLRSGGVFACNVLGGEDDWVIQGRNVSSFTKKTLTALANGFELNEHGFVIGKFWHQLNIVTRKP